MAPAEPRKRKNRAWKLKNDENTCTNVEGSQNQEKQSTLVAGKKSNRKSLLEPMTLIVAHVIDEKLVVVTDGAGSSGPKCGLFHRHGAIVVGWGDYDLSPISLCYPPNTVPLEHRHLVETNYIGNVLPHPKKGKDKFVEVFVRELNLAPNVHNGGRGSAGLLLAFACDLGIEALVYDANSGKGSWQLRPGVLSWPAFFGQVQEVNHMLADVGVQSPEEFVGAVTSIDDFAGKVKTLIAQTSDYMVAKGLVRSIGLPAWLLVLSKDGSASAPEQVP